MTKTKGTGPFRGKKFVPALLLAAGTALVILALALWPRGDDFPRLEVAGFRISREEYVRAMYQARNDVLSDHAAAGISLTEWSKETALGDPCELITERALEILKEYYAVGTLAVERGYLADAGYEAMLQDMERINSQRQEAQDSGSIMTGMIQFSTEDYISYRASAVRLEFTNDSENPEYPVTEEELLSRYEADREELYQQPDELELAFLLADAPVWETESLQQSFEALERRARDLGSLDAALAEEPQMQAYYQQITVNAGTYSTYARAYGDVLNWSENLQTGEFSGVIRQENRLCLIECLERTEHQFRTLADVESLVIQSIRESRYDALIAERMEKMEIRGDLDGLFRFTAEQFL